MSAAPEKIKLDREPIPGQVITPIMGNQQIEDLDGAAVFAAALSLWQACHQAAASDPRLNLSECYNGVDELMRVVMRVAQQFEQWACQHICFDELNDVWPYLLEEKFGSACLSGFAPSALDSFNEEDCLWVALCLALPVVVDDRMPIPVDLLAPNPVAGTGFSKFRIQSVRRLMEDGNVVPFVPGDEPFDEEYGERYFELSGVGEDGEGESIAERKTYREVVTLALNLFPGIAFPRCPTFSARTSAVLSWRRCRNPGVAARSTP